MTKIKRRKNTINWAALNSRFVCLGTFENKPTKINPRVKTVTNIPKIHRCLQTGNLSMDL